MQKTLTLVILLFTAFTFVYAGTTGKIAGIVSDADTGEPLPGVNVYLQESAMGGATDIDGFYSILNVPPGNYTLKIDYVGYASYEITDIKVQIDQTTRIDVNLKTEVLEGETIIVVADRPIVERDISNSQLKKKKKQLKQCHLKQ